MEAVQTSLKAREPRFVYRYTPAFRSRLEQAHSSPHGGENFAGRSRSAKHFDRSPSQSANPRAARRVSTERLRILLVEDHGDTVRTLHVLLTRMGYEVTSAECYCDAVALLADRKFDLLVSDIGLPDGSGWDLMRVVQEQQGIKGIAISGFGMEEDVRRSRDAGFFDHLTKPVNICELEAAIQSANAPDRSQ